jgi:hypothetical protein
MGAFKRPLPAEMIESQQQERGDPLKSNSSPRQENIITDLIVRLE